MNCKAAPQGLRATPSRLFYRSGARGCKDESVANEKCENDALGASHEHTRSHLNLGEISESICLIYSARMSLFRFLFLKLSDSLSPSRLNGMAEKMAAVGFHPLQSLLKRNILTFTESTTSTGNKSLIHPLA